MKKRNRIYRFFRHLLCPPWRVSQHFSAEAFKAIELAIADSEKRHTGEIRLVVESNLDIYEVMLGKTPRQRAIQLFSQLGIWDTEYNNGVLIYLLLADRDVEIVADRGIDRYVDYDKWDAICRSMETNFRQGLFQQGVMQGIEEIGAYLITFFPEQTQRKQRRRKNEIPNKPLVL